MNITNQNTLTQMADITILRNFIYKYENDTRLNPDVVEQLRDELEAMEGELFSKLESDLAGITIAYSEQVIDKYREYVNQGWNT